MFSSGFQETSPFADEFRAFAIAEAHRPLPSSSVLFYGSSSIRLWETLARDFAGLSVVNHGFGGSTLADCVGEMERLVYPVQPRALVLYAGDNDLDQGAPPERVAELFQQFMGGIRARVGAIPVAVLSIKPSPVRFWNAGKIRYANALLADLAGTAPGCRYLDVFSAMLTATGEPRRDLFGEDGLHLNGAGYQLWTSSVRAWLSEFDPPL
jgi:lysophospholipase L1-like esterase